MIILVICIFILGYLAIAFEQPLGLNKAASALMTGVLCWLIYFICTEIPGKASSDLFHHLGEISSILFFLLGAMVIVEIIDSHGGFNIIRQKLPTSSKRRFLVFISMIAFLLSSILDNLTTAIVMTSLTSKMIREKEDKLWFAGLIIIACNAGGVWSPMGDVTTTMLWIGGQVTASQLILKTLFPSLFVWIVPLMFVARKFRGKKMDEMNSEISSGNREGVIILVSGVTLLLFVPVFKILTGMPPFMGMLLALSFIWIITSVIHFKKNPEINNVKFTPAEALQRIDAPSIIFFLGILLAVSALQSFGILESTANYLSNTFKNDYVIGTVLGITSAVLDNVPLVAAVQGMYDLSVYPTDHNFWEFIALTTGTGGSILIIGSAPGVAVMGIEKISFGWYLKKFSLISLLGFAAGIAVYIIQQKSF